MKKLFTNDIFFAITTWFAVLATIPVVVINLLYYRDNNLELLSTFVRTMIAICIAVTYISYKKHTKNVMKGMMGAIMFAIVMLAMITVFEYPEMLIYTLIVAAITLILFVNHFIINSDHNSSPANIFVNQVLSLVFATLTCATSIILLPTCVNMADKIVFILSAIAQPCAMLCIICIESRLDAYRKNREVAGWTQETGYPEGYVHEYQKNK